MEKSQVYQLKRITWNDQEVPIITQNENGPCPLLALSNILLLKGAITIHEDYRHIAAEDLIALLSDYMLNLSQSRTFSDESTRLNYEKNVNDAIAMFPQLLVGLDVNVRFKHIRDFEFTTECLIFDILGIDLVHGWLPDPQDAKLYSLITQLSYNQILDRIVAYQGQSSDNSSTQPAENIDVNQVHLLMQFLDQTASQLTYHGLAELHQHIEDNTFCVLYRNLHFSTLYKHNGSLYILVTDQGYANKPDSDFKVFDPKSDYSPSAVYDPDESSELYARKLQEKYDKELAEQLQNEQEESDAKPKKQVRPLAKSTPAGKPKAKGDPPKQRSKDDSCSVC